MEGVLVLKHKHPTRTATIISNNYSPFCLHAISIQLLKDKQKVCKKERAGYAVPLLVGRQGKKGIRIVPFGGLSFSSFHKKSAQSRTKSTNPKIIPTSNKGSCLFCSSSPLLSFVFHQSEKRMF